MKKVTIFGLSLSLPLLLWQLLFFAFPLIFLFALSFWVVESYRMVPDFDGVNWTKMFSRGVFWDTYLRTLALAAGASVLVSILAFPAPTALPSSCRRTCGDWPFS